MKIICIGKNYRNHIKEMNAEVPKDPVFFMKPDTSLVINNKPFFYPDFSSRIDYELEIVVKICKVGKYIDPKFAHTYYDKIGLGVDFTARDLQEECKKKGLPWEMAKGFNSSAPISKFVDRNELPPIENINFYLNKNGETVQKGCGEDMLFSINEIIAYVSKFVMLKMGDIIFTGTPEGIGPVKIGDRLEAYIEDKKMMDFYIK